MDVTRVHFLPLSRINLYSTRKGNVKWLLPLLFQSMVKCTTSCYNVLMISGSHCFVFLFFMFLWNRDFASLCLFSILYVESTILNLLMICSLFSLVLLFGFLPICFCSKLSVDGNAGSKSHRCSQCPSCWECLCGAVLPYSSPIP